MRLAGAAIALALVQLLEVLGAWDVTGISQDWMRLVFAVVGAGIATSSLGAVLWVALGTLLAALMLVSYTPLVPPLFRQFVRADAPRASVDAVVVFSGGMNTAGRLNHEALERLLDGMQVVRARRVGALGLSIISDGHDARVPSSERDQRALVALGLPGLEPRFVRNVFSTRDEALAFAALARTHGWRRVLAVTSASHTARACGALEAVGLEVECHPAAGREFDVGRLDRPMNRVAAFRAAVYESAATALYRARGWIR